MKINEVKQPSINALFEGIIGAEGQPFSEETVREIAESISKMNNSKQAPVSVEQAIQWLDNM
jgi:hypothetical protein